MKKTLTAFAVLIVLLIGNGCTKDRVVNPDTLNVAQTTIYQENFDASSGLPTGWNAAPNSGWSCDSSNFSTNYAGASGMRNVVIANDVVNATSDTLYSKSIPTTNFNKITVIYAARKSSHFSDTGSSISSFAYSINGGVTWTNLSYTENTGDSNWYLVNAGVRIQLPANAANQAGLMFRWIATTNPTPSGTYRIDDFQLLGTQL